MYVSDDKCHQKGCDRKCADRIGGETSGRTLLKHFLTLFGRFVGFNAYLWLDKLVLLMF